MSPIDEHTDVFVIRDILTLVEQHPETYCVTSLRGLSNLKDLGVKTSAKRVKSFRGTFQQAKLTGFCIASGWIEQHKGIKNSDDLLPELIALSSVMESADFARLNFTDKNFEEAIELSVVHGFENGVRLANIATAEFNRSFKQGQPISTTFLHSFLKRHAQDNQHVPQISFVTQHKNRISAQLRRNGKIKVK